MLATLDYHDYDGQWQRIGVHDRNAKWNESKQASEYAMDIRVPAAAAPGAQANIYTEATCLHHAPSKVVQVTIDRAQPRLTMIPGSIPPGGTATISGTGCYGSRATTVPVQVRWPGGGADMAARRNADRFTVSVTVPASAGLGAGSVTLTDQADCPGAVLPATGAFRVTAAPITTAPPSRISAPTPSAAMTTSPTTSTSPSSPAVPPLSSPPGRTGAPITGSGGTGRSPLGPAVMTLAVLGAAGAGVLLWRRRPRAVPGAS